MQHSTQLEKYTQETNNYTRIEQKCNDEHLH